MLNSRDAANFTVTELRFFERADVAAEESELEASPTKLVNFELKLPNVCFVDSIRRLLATSATVSEPDDTCASLRFRIFKIEPRAGNK
jgi:hypothetical protein